MSTARNIYLKFVAIVLFLSLLASFLNYGLKEFNSRPDRFSAWYINYSPSFDFGETIKILSNSTDTMLTVPGKPLIYWQSGLFPSSPYFFTYEYMYKRDEIASDVYLKFKQNKPQFFYIEGFSDARNFFGEFFKEYKPLKQRGRDSNLLIHINKLLQVTDNQWESVEKYGFAKPE